MSGPDLINKILLVPHESKSDSQCTALCYKPLCTMHLTIIIPRRVTQNVRCKAETLNCCYGFALPPSLNYYYYYIIIVIVIVLVLTPCCCCNVQTSEILYRTRQQLRSGKVRSASGIWAHLPSTYLRLKAHGRLPDSMYL